MVGYAYGDGDADFGDSLSIDRSGLNATFRILLCDAKRPARQPGVNVAVFRSQGRSLGTRGKYLFIPPGTKRRDLKMSGGQENIYFLSTSDTSCRVETVFCRIVAGIAPEKLLIGAAPHRILSSS